MRSKADFISAAYDIKSGIASLSDEGVAEFTSLAALTAKATKSTAGEMTSLFATGYGIYKDYYSDLSDMEFDRDRIAPSDDLDGIVREADILILATPSAYLKTFLEPLTVPLRDKFVVSAIKGIVPGDYQTVVEYVHDHYGLSYKQIGLFTGPSHAEEVSRGKLSYLTVVCTDPETHGASAKSSPAETSAATPPTETLPTSASAISPLTVRLETFVPP